MDATTSLLCVLVYLRDAVVHLVQRIFAHRSALHQLHQVILFSRYIVLDKAAHKVLQARVVDY